MKVRVAFAHVRRVLADVLGFYVGAWRAAGLVGRLGILFAFAVLGVGLVAGYRAPGSGLGFTPESFLILLGFAVVAMGVGIVAGKADPKLGEYIRSLRPDPHADKAPRRRPPTGRPGGSRKRKRR